MEASRRPALGTRGHVAVFAWLLGLILMAPAGRMWMASGLTLAVIVTLYPRAPARLFGSRGHLRIWVIVLLATIFAANVLAGPGVADWFLLGVPVSRQGLVSGCVMVIRAVVVLLAVEGFSSSVDVADMAGLFERIGLRGLGFSLGVAVNLLPSMRQSFTNTWQSLWMRGGFRAERWRGLRLLLVTVIGNALRRSQEIALAAETRAFRPERARSMPLKKGYLDAWIGLFCIFSGVLVIAWV